MLFSGGSGDKVVVTLGLATDFQRLVPVRHLLQFQGKTSHSVKKDVDVSRTASECARTQQACSAAERRSQVFRVVWQGLLPCAEDVYQQNFARAQKLEKSGHDENVQSSHRSTAECLIQV